MKHPLAPHVRTRITDIDPNVDIQPNAVDLKVEKILQTSPSTFVLSEEKKIHRGAKELPLRRFQDEDDWWCLQPGYYELVLQNKIKVGNEEAGFVITRSTLIRNGVYLLSGLYDSGYEGAMVAGLHVTSGPFYIRKGTRVGQYLMFDAQMVREYNGSYGIRTQHDNEKYEKKLKDKETGAWVDKRFKPKPEEIEVVAVKTKPLRIPGKIPPPTSKKFDEDEDEENSPQTIERTIKNEVDEVKDLI